MRERIEFGLVRAVAFCMGSTPRALARLLAELLAGLVDWLHGRLRRVGERNLALAFPELPSNTRSRILRGVYRYLGWQ